MLAQKLPMSNAMGGCRLTDQGLHFGHFLGCLSRLGALAYSHYFFVIGDSQYVFMHGEESAETCVIEFAGDVLACSAGHDVLVVRQTQVLSSARHVREFVCHFATANRLFNTHSERHHLTRGLQTRLTVAQLLFPIDTATTYVALGARQVCMNDDNTRFVGFGAHLARLMNNAFAHGELSVPTLVTGDPPHINGWNYQKMSIRNQNALFYRSTDAQLESLLARLFRKSPFFKAYEKEHSVFIENPRQYRFDRRFLPYSFLFALGDRDVADEFGTGVTMDQFGQMRERLGHLLFQHFRQWRAARENLSCALIKEHLLNANNIMRIVAAAVDQHFQGAEHSAADLCRGSD